MRVVGHGDSFASVARTPAPMAKGDRTVLTLAPREERGSRPNRRLRREGLVPGVIYGQETDA